MLSFLNNVNDEVFSNHKIEVETIMIAVQNLSDAVTHYSSHCLSANVQFSDIENNMQSIKINPSIISMVPYHKTNCRWDIRREKLNILVKRA